jgi:hypothetical protein
MPLSLRHTTLRLGRLKYRLASWYDWVNTLWGYLLDVMYRFHISREDIVGWLEHFADRWDSKKKKATLNLDLIPDDLVEHFARVMALMDQPANVIVPAVIKKMYEQLPPGYRWRKEGSLHYIEKQQGGSPTRERPVAIGQKFIGQVFIGAWWYTDNPTTTANKQLQNALKRNGGGVFYRTKNGLGVTEYYAYAIVPEERALPAGEELYGIFQRLIAEGPTRDWRLSAARLDRLAERQPIQADDIITHPGVFRSVKYNHDFTLTDLLNGRNYSPDITGAIRSILREFEA